MNLSLRSLNIKLFYAGEQSPICTDLEYAIKDNVDVCKDIEL